MKILTTEFNTIEAIYISQLYGTRPRTTKHNPQWNVTEEILRVKYSVSASEQNQFDY